MENSKPKFGIVKNVAIIGLSYWVWWLLQRKKDCPACVTNDCPECPKNIIGEIAPCHKMPFSEVIQNYDGKIIKDCNGYIIYVHRKQLLLVGNTEPAIYLKRQKIYTEMVAVQRDVWEYNSVNFPDTIGHYDIIHTQ